MPTADSGNDNLDAILWGGWKWDEGPITYYFDDDFRTWTGAEKAAYREALAAWAQVADLEFVEVQTEAQADLVAHSLSDRQMNNKFGGSRDPSLEGRHDSVQQVDANGKAHGYFNFQAYGLPASGIAWDPSGLNPGGYGFHTFLQELGLALGLGHPHDKSYGYSTLLGSINRHDYDNLGVGIMNQGPNTVMSYNRGWHTYYNHRWNVRDPESRGIADVGYNLGPGNLDVAAIQYLYGANTTANSGNDIYRLTDASGWLTIWDTGGTDKIAYAGENDVRLDLQSGFLDSRWHNHLNVVKHKDAFGGFIIAGDFTDAIPDEGAMTGVIIENATGGSGDDHILGNAVRNVLRGMGGDDRISAGAGRDKVLGGSGDDFLSGGPGNDKLYGEGGNDVLQGGSGADLLFGSAGNDRLIGEEGNDVLHGGPGDDTLRGDEGSDTFVFRDRSGVDHVVDFDVAQDMLRLEQALWSGVDGIETGQDVIDAFAAVDAQGNVVFAFDGGDRLLLEGIDSLDGIADRIAFL